MFTSKEYLHDRFGVDEKIAKFFVDRKVLQTNNYWKGRYLYIAKGTGFLFIPLYFDLQYRCGITIEELLNEHYVKLMEAILDSAAIHEREEISFQQHLVNCKIIMTGNIRNDDLYEDLNRYFGDEQLLPYKNFGNVSKALGRGDTLLYSLCYLDVDKKIIEKILECWYALVPAFLLMDDIMDLENDNIKNEENSISDFGPGSKGVEKAIEWLHDKFNQLKSYNDKLGFYFERSLENKIKTPYLQSLLNQH